ncbi:MAG: copper resistance D family protein, partial [bacterium]
MALFVDIFGYLSVLLRGLSLASQSLAVGGVVFLLFVVRPLASRLGEGGQFVLARCRRGIALSAFALALFAALSLVSDLGALIDLLGFETADPLNASFVLAGGCQIAFALGLAGLVLARPRASGAALLFPAVGILVASVATSHAAARLDDRALLGTITALHELAAASWIGALPYLLAALSAPLAAADLHTLGGRFSRLAMASVALLLTTAAGLSYFYIGSFAGLYGTAYGAMVACKASLALAVLALGAANSRRVERLARDAGALLPLRRFTELEVGVGLTVFLATASLISVPPAVDLREGRLTLAELGARLTPEWPRFTSPDHADLAVSLLQAKLDAEAAQAGAQPVQAYVPGGGAALPYIAEDIAWSEYNHHWAGVFVLAIGLLSLIERITRARWARSWPLLFIALAVFLLIRSDPEAWPLGQISFWDSLRNPEVAQHRVFMVLITVFALFEWGVRTGRLTSPRAALVFPAVCALAGALLLTHSHG